MSRLVTWDQIDVFDKTMLFAFGLQPINAKNLEIISCPEYCHQYHLLFLKGHEYTHVQKKIDELNHLEDEIMGDSSETTSFTVQTEQDIALFETSLGIFCHYNDAVNLTAYDLKKIKKNLYKSKADYYEYWNKIHKIINIDPDANLWIYFQLPDSKEDIERLFILLNEALFLEDEINWGRGFIEG